jgi:hypothetical protein
LGPTIPVMFSSKFTMVLSAKDLNPLISKDFNRTLQQILAAKDNLMYKYEDYFNVLQVRLYPPFIHKKDIMCSLLALKMLFCILPS